MALQVQRKVLFVGPIVSRCPRSQDYVSIPHKIKGSAGDQNAPNLRAIVIAFKRIGDTSFANKEHFRTTRFAALLAFALVGVSFMGAGVHGNGDSFCIYGIVIIGQLAVDLAAVLPVPARHWGQVGLGQDDFIITAAAWALTFFSVHIPLKGDLTGLTAFQRGFDIDNRYTFPI